MLGSVLSGAGEPFRGGGGDLADAVPPYATLFAFSCNIGRLLEFTHFLSSEMHHALENEGRSTFRQVVFSGCLEENSEGLQRGLRADACAPFGFGFAESSLRFTSVHSRSA